MKAMILAAGLGKRLLPFTVITPKPLFTISGRPVLDIMIHRLRAAGCSEILINTHHLHENINSFLKTGRYNIPVHTVFEPEIAGTGGAIKNAENFWGDKPFMVINSDIVTDIDLRRVYDFHLRHKYHATLVLHDCSEFNRVGVDKENFIRSFHEIEQKTEPACLRKMTFTGIQVLDPEILKFIPDKIFSESISAYKKLISAGEKIKAYIPDSCSWKDIGTPERYKEAVFDSMAPEAFNAAFPGSQIKKTQRFKLKGDGSDRKWYRLSAAGKSLVAVDHGIKEKPGISEADSFISIGLHLYAKKIPVPEIYLYDAFSGMVFMEDLGDINLQSAVKACKDSRTIISCYKAVIDILVKMSVFGLEDFDPSWAFQTSSYNKKVILENECRYFVDSFLKRHLNLKVCFDDFRDEFAWLADKLLGFSFKGLMHRDFQSRNIMIKNKKPYLIDFQGGREGPVQYDLASLMIDPYTELSPDIQRQLVDYCHDRLTSYIHVDKKKFYLCYEYCTITRNLQILGAFGYLSKVKGKKYFEKYIPAAVKSLENNLTAFEDPEFPVLKSTLLKITEQKDIMLGCFA